MNTKVIVGIFLVIAVLAVGGIFLAKPQSEVSESVSPVSTSTPSPTSGTEATVTPSPTSGTGATVTPGALQTYTLEDVARHAVATDCWLAINGKVYNATEFVTKHPGGPAIIKGCGIDASKLFNERPTSGKGPHPSQAQDMLKTLYIGDLSV